MQITVKSDKNCRHPACRRLQEIIENKRKNRPFIDIEWPHKYFPPAGLEIYYSPWSRGDFDNSDKSTYIWRIGGDRYMYQHIYWDLLGQGEERPKVDPKLQSLFEEREERRRILPGYQHDRLRHTLNQQSEVLSGQLNRPISIPSEGEFFLFKANGRTYWAWDFGNPPYGEEIHIMYTNVKKSNYIGMVSIKRSQVLKPCISDCVERSY